MKVLLSDNNIAPEPILKLEMVVEDFLPSGLAFLREGWPTFTRPIWLFDISSGKEILNKRYPDYWFSRNKKYGFLVDKYVKTSNNIYPITEFIVVKEDWITIDIMNLFVQSHKGLNYKKLKEHSISVWISWDKAYIVRYDYEQKWMFKDEWKFKGTGIYTIDLLTSVVNEQYFKDRNLSMSIESRWSSKDGTIFTLIDQNSWKSILLDKNLQEVKIFSPIDKAYEIIPHMSTRYPILWENIIWLYSVGHKNEKFLYDVITHNVIWPYSQINWMNEWKAIVCTDTETLAIDKNGTILFRVPWISDNELNFKDWLVLINWDLYDEFGNKTTFPYVKNMKTSKFLWIVDWLYHFELTNSNWMCWPIFTDLRGNPVSDWIASLDDCKSFTRAHKVKDHLIRVDSYDDNVDKLEVFQDSQLFWEVIWIWNGIYDVTENWIKKKYFSKSNNLDFITIEWLKQKTKLVNETNDFIEINWKKFKKTLTKWFSKIN